MEPRPRKLRLHWGVRRPSHNKRSNVYKKWRSCIDELAIYAAPEGQAALVQASYRFMTCLPVCHVPGAAEPRSEHGLDADSDSCYVWVLHSRVVCCTRVARDGGHVPACFLGTKVAV
jgi:hypothetical protein